MARFVIGGTNGMNAFPSLIMFALRSIIPGYYTECTCVSKELHFESLPEIKIFNRAVVNVRR